MQDTTAIPALALGSDPVSPARRRASVVLGGALSAGVATYGLSSGPGLGLAFFVLAALVVAAWLAIFRASVTPIGWAWSAAALWAAGAYVAYASDWAVLVALPTATALVATLPVVLRARMRLADVGTLPRATLASVGAVPSGIVSAAALPRPALEGRWEATRGVLRGLVLGIPISGSFVLLLSADPAFGALVARVADAWHRAVSFAVWSTTLAAGWLVAHEVHTRAERAQDGSPGAPYRSWTPLSSDEAARGPALRTTTWNVIVAQLVLVFGGFVGANVRYLFGGDAIIRARSSLTYAGYLHAGFAQLSFAAFLAVLVVVVGHRLLRDPADVRAIVPGGRVATVLEVSMLALTGVTLASCRQRLAIYEQAYGYTHLRLAVAFFQLGVFALLALTAAKSIARGWRAWGAGVVVASIAVALAASSIDADRWIAQRNLDRAASGAPLDFEYLAALSDDALPLLDHPAIAGDAAASAYVRARWDARRNAIRAGGWRAFRGLAGAGRATTSAVAWPEIDETRSRALGGSDVRRR